MCRTSTILVARRTVTVVSVFLLLAALVSPASVSVAIPYEVTGLESSTHPVPTTWYADDSPEFQWDSDPVPAVIGNGDTDGRAYGVARAGNLAFVADGLAGLSVVDISELGTPTVLGSTDTSGTARGVDVCGDYAFVAGSDGGLHVVDVSEPGTPTVVGWVDTPNSARRVTVEGHYAFIADVSSLQIADVSDPTSPTVVASVAVGARDVQVRGDVLYVAAGTSALRTYDITDPTAPVFLGVGGTGATSLSVDGGTALVTAGTTIDVLDVSDPTAPSVVGSVEVDTGGLGSFSASGVTISGDFAYVSCTGGGPITDRDFQLLDISDVTLPRLVDTADVSSNTYSLAAFDGHALLANDYDGLAVVEVWEAGVPERIGAFDTEGAAYAVDVQGDLAYFADYAMRLTIVDVSDPTTPALVGTMNQNYAVEDIVVRGDVAYVAASGGGLHVFDVSDPSAPTFLAENDPSSSARGVDAHGDLAVTAVGNGGLQVFDITTPSSPVWLGGVSTGDAAYKVDMCDGLAYVANDNTGLAIVDISEPGTPTVIGNAALPGDPTTHDVLVDGDVAYVGSTDGVHAVDVSDPAHPVHLDSLALPGGAQGLDVAGDTLFAASDAGGVAADDPGALYVVAVTDPTDLMLLESAATRRMAWDVAVAGDVAYVCNDNPNSTGRSASGLDVLSWGGPIGYSYVLDASSAAMPDNSVDAVAPMASFTGIADGEWWFTVKAISRSGDTGPIQQQKVMIDAIAPAADRLFGGTRYTTAVELSKEAFPVDGDADSIVVASGAGFADALSASGLAGALNAPIILVPASGTVPSAVEAEISRLAASGATVWIVGGTAAVSDGVASQLQVGSVGTVDRIFGTDRYKTAAAVAAKIKEIQGVAFQGVAFIASGTNFPDALAVSPVAYAQGFPVLLTKPSSLNSAAQGALADVDTAVILGGTAAVSADTESQIDALPGISVERWWGPGRYDTAVDIAEKAEAKGWAEFNYVGIASGENYPDALAGGPLAGDAGGVMLLVRKRSLPGATSTFLSDNKSVIQSVQAYGGASAVEDAVLTSVNQALQ